jgi:hypothetical protein
MGFFPALGAEGFNRKYRVVAAADQTHVPRFTAPAESANWSKAWSWNRHERHQVTKTYRYFLCPLWAGSSGHTGGGIEFWTQALGERVRTQTSAIVCSGLFTLWRLYYDKRISGFHTLVETFEASCNQNVIGNVGTTAFPKNALKQVDILKTKGTIKEDDLELIVYCATQSPSSPLPQKQFCVDPILLLRAVKIKYYDSTEGNHAAKQAELNRLIIQAKDSLTQNGYKVLQWTDEISKARGTSVQSFDIVLSNLNLSPALPDSVLPNIAKFLK